MPPYPKKLRVDSEVARNIRVLRESRGENQTVFATAVIAKPSVISKWEAGKNRPTPDAFVRLSMLATGDLKLFFLKQAGVPIDAGLIKDYCPSTLDKKPSRLEQMGQLLTAMIAVVLTGTYEDTAFNHCSPKSIAPKKRRKKAKGFREIDPRGPRGRGVNLLVGKHDGLKFIHDAGVGSWEEISLAMRPNTTDLRMRAALRVIQIIPSYAKSLGLDGLSKDRLLQDALACFVEQDSADVCAQYPDIKRALLYRKLPTAVALKEGVSLSFVCRVIKGQSISSRVKRAVLQEIVRIEQDLKNEVAQ